LAGLFSLEMSKLGCGNSDSHPFSESSLSDTSFYWCILCVSWSLGWCCLHQSWYSEWIL